MKKLFLLSVVVFLSSFYAYASPTNYEGIKFDNCSTTHNGGCCYPIAVRDRLFCEATAKPVNPIDNTCAAPLIRRQDTIGGGNVCVKPLACPGDNWQTSPRRSSVPPNRWGYWEIVPLRLNNQFRAISSTPGHDYGEIERICKRGWRNRTLDGEKHCCKK